MSPDESKDLTPNWNEHGLVAVIAQDSVTGDVLMMAWMNEDALQKTIETGQAHYWSRSRGELWHKGATSGAFQIVKDIRIDCDEDCLLLTVEQQGSGACHTGAKTCFFRPLAPGKR
jgi:phosphoribosyl-AMP cyclohydrolase